MLKHILLIGALLCCLNLSAQEEYPWEFSFQLGVSSLGGDMADSDFVLLNQSSFSAGVHLRRRLGGIFALRAHILYGGIDSDDSKSDEADRVARGFMSSNSVIEPGLVLELEPLANRRFGADGTFKKILSPYVYGGVAYGIWQESETDYNGRTGAGITTDMMNTSDSNGGIVIPVGGGIRWYLSPKTSLAFDVGVRITGDDLLDGVSEAGNPEENDVYTMSGLALSVGFGQKDADKDGIPDDEDVCPEQAGPASTGGCPDSDEDGIADKDDACPNEAGVANLAGCPDNDNDGVANKDDACPDEAGVASLQGCPDSDGDGIKDSEDDCPTVAGVASLAGCPDSDGDGIKDSEDDCPTVAGVASRNGCPEPVEQFESLADRITRYQELVEGLEFVSVDESNGTIQIENLYFDTDRNVLRNKGNRVLDDVVTFLSRPGAEDFTLRFEGHADERNTESYNQSLSERRAKEAMEYVAKKGIDASRLSMIGYGETSPVGTSLQENRVVVNAANEPPRRINE